eukprot:CAMPEP_0176285138 /NCGR_PEP_ID=MMETSP0121_2-20121125/52212_1 /TAXON_ID=160619 /ORGANISM="Kryptoperidinium foliaceum, Strain CCMP 1326" /LENGTH=36 /DNA_ID= /DNA_START= /DNA_END= /DNA_ORIENTATION=
MQRAAVTPSASYRLPEFGSGAMREAGPFRPLGKECE